MNRQQRRAEAARPRKKVAFQESPGEQVTNYDRATVQAAALFVIAEVLEHLDKQDYVANAVTTTTLLEAIPPSLVLGSALEQLGQILGDLARVSPELAAALQVAGTAARSTAFEVR